MSDEADLDVVDGDGQSWLVVPSPDDPSRVLVLGGAGEPAIGDPLASVPNAVAKRLVEAAGASGHVMAAGQMLSGRWVQLTAESARKMAEAGGPALDGAGIPMAILRGDTGGFSHVVRFGSLGAAPLAASGMVGGLAVQLALYDIERQLSAISETLDVLVEGSKIEVEARLAASLDVIRRVERRLDENGHLDDRDWTSLATLEPTVKQTYHQVVRWLDPLRDALEDGEFTMSEQVRLLRSSLETRDLGFWLRMFVYSELALKRWEALYVIHQVTHAPDHAAAEAGRLVDRMAERRELLEGFHADIAAFLDSEQALGTLARMRIFTRRELSLLRRHLADVHNAYAAVLRDAALDVPEYDPDRIGGQTSFGVDVREVGQKMRDGAGTAAERLRQGAAGALEQGRDATGSLADWLRTQRDQVADRLTTPDDPIDPDE